MKINKNSWHYKLNEKMDIEVESKTLCSYFWNTIANLFGVFLICISILTLIGLITVPLWGLVINYFGITELPQSTILYIFYIEIIIALLIISVSYYDKFSFSRIIVSYLASIKNKVCPRIEFDDK